MNSRLRWGAAEADVGADFRQVDAADEVSGRVEHLHAVQARAGPAGTGPDVAVPVRPEPVGHRRAHVHKLPAAAHRIAVNVKHANVGIAVRIVAGGRVADVEQGFVGREAKAVRLGEVGDDRLKPARQGIQAVHVGRKLGFRDTALVVVQDAVAGIREPYAAVGLDHHVVGRIEPLP